MGNDENNTNLIVYGKNEDLGFILSKYPNLTHHWIHDH